MDAEGGMLVPQEVTDAIRAELDALAGEMQAAMEEVGTWMSPEQACRNPADDARSPWLAIDPDGAMRAGVGFGE